MSSGTMGRGHLGSWEERDRERGFARQHQQRNSLNSFFSSLANKRPQRSRRDAGRATGRPIRQGTLHAPRTAAGRGRKDGGHGSVVLYGGITVWLAGGPTAGSVGGGVDGARRGGRYKKGAVRRGRERERERESERGKGSFSTKDRGGRADKKTSERLGLGWVVGTETAALEGRRPTPA